MKKWQGNMIFKMSHNIELIFGEKKLYISRDILIAESKWFDDYLGSSADILSIDMVVNTKTGYPANILFKFFRHIDRFKIMHYNFVKHDPFMTLCKHFRFKIYYTFGFVMEDSDHIDVVDYLIRIFKDERTAVHYTEDSTNFSVYSNRPVSMLKNIVGNVYLNKSIPIRIRDMLLDRIIRYAISGIMA